MTTPDAEAYRAEFERLEAELKAHPGTKADQMAKDVERAFVTWHQRSRELHAVLHYGETDEDMQTELMQNVRPPVAREQYMRALDSALNAYLGAMGTLIDVARRISKKLPESFQSGYAERSQTVRDIEGVVVLRDLRNYMLHYSSAPWRADGNITADGMTTRISLDSATLAEWNGWKADSRKYLADNQTVRLIEIVVPYEAAMTSLFAWFGEEFYKIKQSDIGAANDLVRRVNLHMSGGATDGKDWQKRMMHVQENLRRSRAGEPQIDYETGLELPE